MLTHILEITDVTLCRNC